MHYKETPDPEICSNSQQFSVSPDLIPTNELKIKYRKLNPYTSDEINILLLENISEKAVKIFKDAGFKVNCAGFINILLFTIILFRWNAVKKHFLPRN